MLAPKSERLSRMTKPPSVRMSKFNNFRLVLWSFTSHNLVEPFLGMVNTGCATIPGRVPKAWEYQPSEISVSHCDFKNDNESSLSAGSPCGHITHPYGRFSDFLVMAKGQKLDLRPWHTDTTSSLLGWLCSSCLKWSMSIGVMMQNKWG